MEELINEIKEAAAKIDAIGDEIQFSDQRYKSIPFAQKNFHAIDDKKTERNLCFIDGGNCEIIRMPNMSVQLARTAFVIFRGKKKIMQQRKDVFVIAKYFPKKDAYSMKMIPAVFGEEMLFSSFDETLREGMHRANISKMGEVARRFLEIEMAKEVVQHLSAGDIIVRDGTLQSSVTGEGRFLHDLYSWANEKKVIVCALAKSCSLLTKKGNNAVSALLSIAPIKKWSYYPAAEISHPDHLADLCFAKLQDKSKYAFRIEFYKKSDYNVDEVLALLSENANDAQFLGYPYGLIAADKLAKVEEREAEIFRTRIMAKLGKELESGINALNAHDLF